METVRYHPDALKSLKQHANVASRVRRAIEAYAAETGAHANRITAHIRIECAGLVGSTASRLRVGDFRAIFEESDTEIYVTKAAPMTERKAP